jgi:hypothetical protein
MPNSKSVVKALPSQMTVLPNGNVGIGTTNPNHLVQITGNTPRLQLGTPGESGGIIYFGNSGHGVGRGANIITNNSGTNDVVMYTAGDGLLVFGTTSTRRMYIDTSGLVFRQDNATSFNAASDRRIKTNIEEINTEVCWNNIKSVPLKRYVYDPAVKPSLAELPDKHMYGFIAQDVEKIFPKSVTASKDSESKIDDLRTLSLDQIMFSLYGAFMEAQKRIEHLEMQVKVLMTTT